MKEMALLFGALLTGMGLYGYFGPAAADKAGEAVENRAESNDDVAEESDKKDAEAETKGRSKTALIPAIFGLPLIMCGTLAFLGDDMRKHAMHGAAAVALIGAVLSLGRGLMKVSSLWGDDPTAQKATMMTLIMGTICLIYVVLSVRSFIAAKKAREAGMDASPDSAAS